MTIGPYHFPSFFNNANFKKGLTYLSLSHHYPREGETYLSNYLSWLIGVYTNNGLLNVNPND